MTSKRTVCALAVGLLLACTGGPAAADVTVTVQITGTIEEILPILQMLQQTGLEKAAAEHMEGLKLEIESTTVAAPETAAPAETAPPAEAAPATPAPPPQPMLGTPTVEPATAKPGDSVLVTVPVADPGDPAGRVDTLAARTAAPGTYAFDLYDNGTQGDAVANDGIWSYRYTVDPNTPAGPLTFEIIAYDASADPVKVRNEAGEEIPLTTQAVVNVQP